MGKLTINGALLIVAGSETMAATYTSYMQ